MMIKRASPPKGSIGLTPAAPRPSRIRRDPPSAVVERKELTPHPTDREVRTVVIGVLLFALAIVIITLQFSDITSR